MPDDELLYILGNIQFKDDSRPLYDLDFAHISATIITIGAQVMRDTEKMLMSKTYHTIVRYKACFHKWLFYWLYFFD